jgi:hypothetical protein
MSPDCRAAVVIPCLNERDDIEETSSSVIAAAGKLLTSGQVEIIYVDSLSKDGTPEYLTSLSEQLPGVHVLSEPTLGIGNARRAGVGWALSRANRRASELEDSDFWLISTDSDTIVPDSWLQDWYTTFSSKPAPIMRGFDRFPDQFDEDYPNAIKVFAGAGKLMRGMGDLFGPSDVDGTNCAIEREAYYAAGPFEQPQMRNSHGDIVNLAGEDYDLGARARALGISIGTHEAKSVTISSRRFAHDPRGFLSGKVYQEGFVRVDTPDVTADLADHEVPIYIEKCMQRCIGQIICKPILIDGVVPTKPEVEKVFGTELISGMNQWLTVMPRPDLVKDRNAFMIDYLGDFHREFGSQIAVHLQERQDR